jgi:hypothetical protein
MARRIAGRDRPYRTARSASLSRRSPGAVPPLRIASSNCRATWLYRGTGLERSSCGSIVAVYVPPSVEPRWTTRSSAALILAASITSITAIA